MSQSAFARRMLEKQGWKEGDGLGKNRDGIQKPIKATLKKDKTGVGHDPGSDFTDHWWLRVFNDAADSITKTNEAAVVNEKETSQNKLYQGFRKGSTLTEGKESKDSDCSSDDDESDRIDNSRLPTLDDIHKFCGGATGSRAATLGIKMKGKLSRAMEQERLFVEKMKDNLSEGLDVANGDSLESTSKRKKKKKKRDENSEYSPVTSEDLHETKVVNNGIVTHESRVEEESEEVSVKKGKKEKKRKRKDIANAVVTEALEDMTSSKNRKKSKCSEPETNLSGTEENDGTLDESASPKLKKKKKKKKHKEEC